MTVQLDRLPALSSLCNSVGGKLQVACAPACRGAWELLPQLEKIIPFDFDGSPSLADWANLLGSVREPDFQVCLNFAEGQQVNLMLSMSHIQTRLAPSGFSSTQRVSPGNGWPAQSLEAFLQPLGVALDANGFRLSLSSADLDATRTELPPGDGPLLLLAPNGSVDDWPDERWTALPDTIASRLNGLRSSRLSPGLSLRRRAAAVASSDVVLSSCPVTQQLAVYAGTPLVAMGARPDALPSRDDLRCIGTTGELNHLGEEEVLRALGF